MAQLALSRGLAKWLLAADFVMSHRPTSLIQRAATMD